jgi:hypothetical protein
VHARRSFAIAGAITGIAALAAVAAAALVEPSFLHPLHPGTHDQSARIVQSCPAVIGTDPVKALPCQSRVVRGLPAPKYADDSAPPSPVKP